MNKRSWLTGSVLAGALLWSGASFGQAAFTGMTNVDVNLRAGPDTEFPVVTVLPTNTSVTVFGCDAAQAWCDVEAAGARGWIAAQFINYAIPTAPAPVPLPQAVATVQVPVVTYEVGPYWDAHYATQPFYGERERFASAAGGGIAGAAGGAAIGGVIGGPVGAVVGGAIGAGVGAGAATAPPRGAPLTGAAGGAAVGAVVGGPVGAAVGGAIGLAAGAAFTPPPPAVTTYVTQQQVASVAIPGTIAVGTVLPTTTVLHPIPDYEYQFAVVNNQRVFVKPDTREVVYILN
jgi:uncharacterized protein YraI